VLSVTPLAYGKIQPIGQPDIRLDIQAGTMLATEEKRERFYSDVGKVHQIFDEVMVPAFERFLGEHWDELEGKDVRRADDPKDRRRTIVEPVRNNKLERKLEAIFTPFHEKMYDLLSSYSDSELAFLLDVMTKSIELTREESRKLRNQKG